MGKRDHGLLAEIERDVLSTAAPLADALRKCVVLGGKAGSRELRDWASRELRGYEGGDDVPPYRVVPAPLMINGISGRFQIKGQRFSPSNLPDFAQEHIKDEVALTFGIGEIEAMADRARTSDDHHINLQPSGGADLVRLMNAQMQMFQEIHDLYWSVSEPALRGVVDQVRTTLAELVAELRAGMADADETPSAEAADQAVSLAVHGKRSRVHVNTAQASGQGSISKVQIHEPPEQSGFWTRSRRIGAFVVGAAGIVGAVAGVAQWQGWPPF